jgi:hypothetical protein
LDILTEIKANADELESIFMPEAARRRREMRGIM